MRLYDLGRVPWQDSQLAYHALAGLGREGLILCSPAEPYVSVGYFQDPAQELDLEHCRRAGLPVFRREVGGGAVYLDRHQVFWQVVLHRGNPLVSLNRAVFYRRLLEPVVAACRRLGVAAGMEPVNDVVAGGRRLAGTGAGEIGDCVVFVGNILRRFDCRAMALAINAPNEVFRARYRAAMEEELTSLERELGPERETALTESKIHAALAGEFGRVAGPLRPGHLDGELRQAMDDLAGRMLSPEWTYRPRKPRPLFRVKVKAGLYLHHWQGAGHLQAQFTSRDDNLIDIRLFEGGNGASPRQQAAQDFLGGDVRGFTKYLGEIAAEV